MPTPETKAAPVVSTPAKIKSKKNRDNSLFAQDLNDIKDSIVKDYVLPKAKNLVFKIVQDVFDTMSESVQMMIFGEVRRASSSNRPTDYTTFSNKSRSNYNCPTMTQSYNFDELFYGSMKEAEDVLFEMREIIDQYGKVPVSRLYELSGLTSPRSTDENYGWTNLDYATCKRSPEGGYIIDLPKAKVIK